MLLCPGLRLALVAHVLTDRVKLVVCRENKITTEGQLELSEELTAVISPALHSMNRADWEKSVPHGNFFMRWDFLAAFERTAVSSIGFYYVQLYKKGKPYAVFYFQRIHLTVEEIGHILRPLAKEVKSHSLIGQWGEWLQKTKEEKGFRMLVSGNNFISGEYGVGLSENADPHEVFDAMAGIVKWITRTDRTPAKISAILVKDYFSSGAPKIASDRLKKKRYHRFLVEPEMIISLEKSWKSFDDYIGAMSKKYRNRLRAVYKKSAPLELVEMDAEMIKEHEAELYRLYFNVYERAKFRLAALGENYFSEMKRNFPAEFCFVAYKYEDKIVSFRSSFRTNNHLEAHFIGIDYERSLDLCLYQRILYDYVAEGLIKGVAQVYLGRTAAEIKSTVGAVAHDLVCYIRHRNGLSNQVIRPFIDYLKPSVWVPRNPFRESDSE